MDDPGVRSPDSLRPLQPLLSSVAENASNLAVSVKHQHEHHLSVDVEARSLQPLQSAVAEYDHYELRQHQHQHQHQNQDQSVERQLQPEDAFSALIPQDQTTSLRIEQSQTTNPNESIFSSKEHGYLRDVASVVDPPHLEAWRDRLFNVDETIVMSEEEFRTYFPHVDNIYSHRSTQHYKRKPLVSHYWDCRLKGRPPGTPKSDDPNKKKRKRTARQRDLCDVKIKITEYFPGYAVGFGTGSAAGGAEGLGPTEQQQQQQFSLSFSPNGVGVDSPLSFVEPLPSVNALLRLPSAGSASNFGQNQPFGVLTPNPPLPEGHPGADGQRFFTIQRVNGNGANGKNDGVSGGHRHTLEESDRVKKNSVQRFLLKEARERKKMLSATTRTMSAPKSYHTQATGAAAETVANHSKESDLKLYGSCFCPFVQRVWIALELKGLPYQYIEVDPYKKPQLLLDVNPKGLVPALRHGEWGSYESSVLLEYLEDLNVGPPLLPPGDAKLRAHCRLWTDFVNRHIVPNFYRVLQEQDQKKQIEHAQELHNSFNTLIEAADPEGPFFLGQNISFVDVQIAPWVVRLNRVLKPYRGWPDPDQGTRWCAWVDAIEANESIKATTSLPDLYLDSYERYAENRPNTSPLANAINSGRGLP
ncbi:hypothetical protein BDW75DRAFT_232671 [Aspergillus navahoensis]